MRLLPSYSSSDCVVCMVKACYVLQRTTGYDGIDIIVANGKGPWMSKFA